MQDISPFTVKYDMTVQTYSLLVRFCRFGILGPKGKRLWTPSAPVGFKLNRKK